MPIQPGTRLGPYDITQSIGAGGMGEVYRAHDTRLNRDVAVKILPELFASDPDRLTRFEREAQAVAGLSHPNILAIHDFGRAPSERPGRGPTVYAVMELLEGETLRGRLSAGPLTTRKCVEYGVQVAHGLAAAHDKGIVHRDLKPENLFVTRDDRVKILDFGLAKPFDLGGATATVAGTSATAAGTTAGTILGTVGYMAPEQLRGQPVDHRSDIFAFGVVLYEMLSGRRAFTGDTPADTIGAILNTEPPDLETSTSGITPALDRIVRRCLEKKPELRFQSARDLAFALDTLTGRTTSAIAAPPAETMRPLRPPARFAHGLALGLLVAGGAAAAIWALRPRADEPRWQQFTQVTDAVGPENSPSLSPDGNTVAYAARVDGTWDIFIQRVGGRNPAPVAADSERDEGAPAFSPDGSLIAFHESDEDGGIFVAGATGEAYRRVTNVGFHPAWSPDGKRIAFSTEEIIDPAARQGRSALWIVEVAGGEPRAVNGAGDAAQPSWSPSGERIVYWSNTGGQRDIYTVPAAGGERVAVVEDAALDWSAVWGPDGASIFFASDRGGSMNIWRAAVDESGRPAGPPVPVTTGVPAGMEQPSLSKDGSRLAFRARSTTVNPVAIPFDPEREQAGPAVVLTNTNAILRPNVVSPDGRWISYYNQGGRQEDIFISAGDGSGLRRITDDAPRDRGPVWTPDGKALLFYTNRGGRWEIWRVGRDGGGLQKVAGLASDDVIYPVPSPAGDRLVVSALSARRLFSGRLSGGEVELTPLENAEVAGGMLLPTSWSPDGARLTGTILAPTGRPLGIGVYDLDTKSGRRLTEDATDCVRWLPDGRRVVYITRGGELVVVDVTTSRRTVVPVELPVPPSHDMIAVSPDARRILYAGEQSESDIWIVERRGGPR